MYYIDTSILLFSNRNWIVFHLGLMINLWIKIHILFNDDEYFTQWYNGSLETSYTAEQLFWFCFYLTIFQIDDKTT